MNLIEERTIALAAVVQACRQVQLLAREGQSHQADTEPLKQSILILDAVSTPAVYGGLAGVKTGLKMIGDGLLGSPQGENVEILRYTMSLLHLQTQLYRDSDSFQKFGQAIERLSGEAADDLEQACSGVYQDFISGMRPQIIVQGEEGYLQRPEVPPQIRMLLLAGIRSAVLWQQKDGSRFKILWQRTRMQNAANALLQQITIH